MAAKKNKILVADDESSLRTLLRAIIESEEEFIYEEAVDGEDALAKAESFRPDIMILDVMMPGFSGYEVCEKIKANPELKHTQVLILTGKGKESAEEWAKSVGADHFMAKPFSPVDLLDLLKSKVT